MSPSLVDERFPNRTENDIMKHVEAARGQENSPLDSGLTNVLSLSCAARAHVPKPCGAAVVARTAWPRCTICNGCDAATLGSVPGSSTAGPAPGRDSFSEKLARAGPAAILLRVLQPKCEWCGKPNRRIHSQARLVGERVRASLSFDLRPPALSL